MPVAVEASVEPPFGEVERLGGVFAGCVARGALVEGHHDVGPDGAFGIDDVFGGEEVLRAVDVGTEITPLLLELAARGEGEDLKAAAVGEHGSVPGGEAMDASGAFEDLHAGPQVEVVCIGQYDLSMSFVADVPVEDSLDGSGGAYGHEDRGPDRSVIGLEFTGAGLRGGVFLLEGKFHTHLFGKNTENLWNNLEKRVK